MVSAVVDAEPLVPPRLGLLASAQGPPADEDPERWQAGFTWTPRPCGGLSGWDVCSPGSVNLVPASSPGRQQCDPVVLEAEFRCSTLGLDDAYYRQVATELLLACQSKGLALELWAGPITTMAGTGNKTLVNSAADLTPSAAPANGVSAKRGLAILEQALGDCGCGARGMIHCQRSLVQPLGVRRDGNYLLSNLDTIIVPDAGYPGFGPGLAIPTGLAATTATTGGTLTPGAYSYRVTAVSATGETLPSQAINVTVPAGTATNTVAVTWTAVPGAASYRVYGRSGGTFGLLGNPTTATFTDTGAATPGTAAPTTNTSGAPQSGTTWAYATGMVTVRLGDIATTPDDPAQAVDRATNTVRYTAHRAAAATWPGCCTFAVHIDLNAA